MNDDALASEYHNLYTQADYVEAFFIDNPDFADFAEPIDAEGHTVRSVEVVGNPGDALGRVQTGPVVVDC